MDALEGAALLYGAGQLARQLHAGVAITVDRSQPIVGTVISGMAATSFRAMEALARP